MKILCASLGVLMLFGGIVFAGASAGMKTTVIGEDGREIHNIGLIGKQQADTTLCSAVAVAGAVLLSGAGVIEAVQIQGRRLAELADKQLNGLKAMFERLDWIVANSQTHATPRVATLKADAAFDALVDAELQPPRSAPQPVRTKTQPPPPPGLR